ncbi:MAG: sialate O-acetylesterase [Alistipes sp.]|nr:sialate O-acetylesterase [Alistipes sp.]
MKRFIVIAAMLLAAASAQAQKYSPYYHQRASLFEVLPVGCEDIIFLGNSITDGCEWNELFDNPHVKNRGISGDISEGICDRLDAIIKGHPAKIFLMIGTNDLARGISVDEVVANTAVIADRTAAESPETKLYIQSILPVSPHYGLHRGHTGNGEIIREANRRLSELAAEKGVVYIDLHSLFTDPETGDLNLLYSNDGLHLNGAGYLLWRDAVASYVN